MAIEFSELEIWITDGGPKNSLQTQVKHEYVEFQRRSNLQVQVQESSHSPCFFSLSTEYEISISF